MFAFTNVLRLYLVWVKTRPHLTSTSVFVFSKIIEAMLTKRKCKEFYVLIFCISINVPTDTMLKFYANVDVDAKCERIFSRTSVRDK